MLYLYITLGVAAVAYIGLFTVKVLVKKKRAKVLKQKQKDNLDIVDDVRYTMEDNPVASETNMATDTMVNATYQQKDIILNQNTPVTVSKDGEVKPGKYILLSTDENQDSFNVRIGIYVKEYKHNQEVVLAEGDTICAVSSNIILR
ncbi:MAG: hypothetical protein MR288_03405 [Firmicutes bacterium]|nr:hypothetical protein [Bacillota bacterium]MDY5042167.1 hypothetical protein [Eubacteriales bacterium]